MKIKFNFGVLKSKTVRFERLEGENILSCEGVVSKVKEKKGKYWFCFEDGRKVEVADNVLLKMQIRRDEDSVVFTYPLTNKVSGLVGFSMSDTYGFPVEITEEILSEKGLEMDVEGYYVLRNLQKELSNGTYKPQTAW